MINAAMAQASYQIPPPAPPQSLKGKLAAIWTAIKDRISAWLSPVVPWWVRFVNALKEKLYSLINGNEVLIWTGLAALAIALVAALVKSMALLIAVLAIIGLGRVLKDIIPGWGR
jgi:cobalamin biosynthesis protein CobD/CbiB